MLSQAQVRAHNEKQLARLRGLPRRFGVELSAVYQEMAARHVLDVRGGFTGRPGLIRRSGRLQGSIKARESGGTNLDKLTVSTFSSGTERATLTGQSYARLQEFGGTIRAKRAAALTIPLSRNNVGPNGLPKYRSARQLWAQGRTKLVKTRSGKFLILVREGSNYRAMWVLKSSVEIPPRLRFYDSFRDRKPERAGQIMQALARAAAGGK